MGHLFVRTTFSRLSQNPKPFAFLEEAYSRLILAPVRRFGLFESEDQGKLVEGVLLVPIVQELDSLKPPVANCLLVVIENPLQVERSYLTGDANMSANNQTCVRIRRLVNSEPNIGLIHKTACSAGHIEPLQWWIG